MITFKVYDLLKNIWGIQFILLNNFAGVWVWTYLLIKIFGIVLFKIKFIYKHLLTIIKFRLFLKKNIVCNIFENCKFRFNDEWFSKKSYIDIYFFMSGLIFDFTVKHKIYIFENILSVYLMILMHTMIILIFGY